MAPTKAIRPRLSLVRPGALEIGDFIAEQRELAFSYAPPGCTREPGGGGSADFNLDEIHQPIGRGGADFARARDAIRRWAMFEQDWVQLCWPNTGICAGSAVGVLARIARGWILCAARIVYVVDDSGDTDRFGFAYGTLPGHVVRGEERFAVEWNRRTDEVSYRLTAVSRPGPLLAWASYPLVRQMQRRFRQDSVAAIRRSMTA